MSDLGRQYTQLEVGFDESTSQPVVAAQVGFEIVVDEVVFTNNEAAASVTLTLESTLPTAS
jgi:hypothetical protein